MKVLGPAFEAAGLSTKIYAYDHNYNYDNKSDQNGYPYQIYNDSEAAKYIAGAPTMTMEVIAANCSTSTNELLRRT